MKRKMKREPSDHERIVAMKLADAETQRQRTAAHSQKLAASLYRSSDAHKVPRPTIVIKNEPPTAFKGAIVVRNEPAKHVDPAVLTSAIEASNKIVGEMRRRDPATLYRIDHRHRYLGRCVEWAVTRSEASKRRNALCREARQQDSEIDGYHIMVTRVEVPREARALVQWLNLNLTRDNR